MFLPTLRHLQVKSEALGTKAFVECLFGWFLGVRNQIYANAIEQNFPKERMNCVVSNSKTYHVTSDKTAVTINSTVQFKIRRHQIERTSQSAAFAIMHFCAFSM